MSARDTLVLAAYDLVKAGNKTFSEWDLTVAAWSLDRKMFGMRNYPYPDHKRVYCELVKCKLWLRKLSPSTYVLTELGNREAKRLRKEPISEPRTSVAFLYEYVQSIDSHVDFSAWLSDPGKPAKFDKAVLRGETFQSAQELLTAAMDWCKTANVAYLVSGTGRPIHASRIADCMDFLQAMEYRCESASSAVA